MSGREIVFFSRKKRQKCTRARQCGYVCARVCACVCELVCTRVRILNCTGLIAEEYRSTTTNTEVGVYSSSCTREKWAKKKAEKFIVERIKIKYASMCNRYRYMGIYIWMYILFEMGTKI